MIDLTKNPYGKYNGKEMEYVLQMLDPENNDVNQMSWPQRFEEKFCDVMGVSYAIACNSGTSGLHAAVVAAGVGPGDEVISPGLTVVMDAFAIIHAGGIPVFADINPETQSIDPDDVERKITSKTKAIITVSLQGLPVDIDPIMKIARRHNLIVIEDSAQTMLGKYHGRIAGTLGHIGVFSFENKKHMTCGSEGGMIVSNDEQLAQRIRKFAGIGYKHMTARAGRTSLALSEVQSPEYERFDTIGLNYRMSEISAAVGLAQFERISELITRRQRIAEIYDRVVEGCDWVVKQKTPEGYEHSYYTYSIKYLGEDKFGVTWKDFYNKYLEMGGDGFYGACKVPYLEPVFQNREINGIRYEKGICPKAEDLQPKLMQFKTNYRNIEIAKKKIEILGKLIRNIEKGRGE
jgi:perosamine synthetase